MNEIKKNAYDALAEKFIGSDDLRKIKSFPLLIETQEYIDENKEYLMHEALLFDKLDLELFNNNDKVNLGNLKDLIGFDSEKFGKVVILKDNYPIAYINKNYFVY